MLQILVSDLRNDLFLPVTHCGFYGGWDDEGRVCIGDKPIRNYIPKHLKQMININNIQYVFETYIIDTFLQYDLNKRRIRQ